MTLTIFLRRQFRVAILISLIGSVFIPNITRAEVGLSISPGRLIIETATGEKLQRKIQITRLDSSRPATISANIRLDNASSSLISGDSIINYKIHDTKIDYSLAIDSTGVASGTYTGSLTLRLPTSIKKTDGQMIELEYNIPIEIIIRENLRDVAVALTEDNVSTWTKVQRLETNLPIYPIGAKPIITWTVSNLSTSTITGLYYDAQTDIEKSFISSDFHSFVGTIAPDSEVTDHFKLGSLKKSGRHNVRLKLNNRESATVSFIVVTRPVWLFILFSCFLTISVLGLLIFFCVRSGAKFYRRYTNGR